MKYNFDLLKRPFPFQPGNMTLWDNEYIAYNVLNKHLNKNIDSGSRKESTIVDSVQWINEKFPKKGNVLDIGCGPGLYANLLSDCGFFYHGIDISKYQIEYALNHSRYKDNIFETMDFRNIQLSRNYDLVLMLYGIYSFYKLEDRIHLLRNVKNSMSPDGKVLVEVFTKNHYSNRSETQDWELVEKDGFWSHKPYLELNAFYKYESIDLVLVQAAKVDDSIKIWNSWIQTFSIENIQWEFRMAGFSEFEVYSSCKGDKYFEKADVLCMIAR